MVQIEQHVWGMTPEGEAIVLYTLRNDQGAEVRLSNYGAAIVSVTMPDREGRMADVVLGYRHPEGYFHDGAASGKSVGRCANRIAFGRMTVEGEEYALEVNNGVNHLHGGTNNFANRVWESRVETNRVVMTLVSEDGDQGYPGELCVEAVFDFDDENALEITYRARTDKTTVVNLTNHVYFNLAGDGSGSVLDHELRLNSSKALEMNERQIPTGRLLDVAGTPQDFRSFRPFRPGIDSEFNHIRDFKGYDHPFVIDGWKPNILGEVGELRDPKSGRCVRVLSSQPSVMIYTGNWLAGGCPETKTGGRYADYDGVAMECQNYPDAVNHPEFPSPLLRPARPTARRSSSVSASAKETVRGATCPAKESRRNAVKRERPIVLRSVFLLNLVPAVGFRRPGSPPAAWPKRRPTRGYALRGCAAATVHPILLPSHGLPEFRHAARKTRASRQYGLPDAGSRTRAAYGPAVRHRPRHPPRATIRCEWSCRALGGYGGCGKYLR